MALVSVAVPFDRNWYFDTVVEGFRSAVADEGHELVVHVHPPGAAGREAITALLDGDLADSRFIGAVAVQFRLLPEQAARVSRHGKPVVLIGGTSPDLPSVRLDDVRIARSATEHLLGLGHRNIAHLAGYAVAPDDFTVRTDRVRGYSDAMRDAGLEALCRVRPSEFRFEAAKRQATELLTGQDRPTAVFAVVDELAFGVLAAADDLGLAVPGDLSVIGIDDHRDSAGLGLTTMRQDTRAAGRTAAERLLGRSALQDQVLDVQLVVRSTTAPVVAPRARGFLSRVLGRREA